MSQSTMALLHARHQELPAETEEISYTGAEMQHLLDALEDGDCRTILEAADDFLSANELSERCDIPLSTTYRKVEALTEAGLLEEGTRVCRSGKHTSEYRRRVDNVVVSMRSTGFDLRVTRREHSERSVYSPLAGGR